MINTQTYQPKRSSHLDNFANAIPLEAPSRHLVIAGILIIALCAFEIFNFDTTRFALASLIGEKSFIGVTWAAVLAIAFCAIDFAGLARIFAPEGENGTSKEEWYLMGAWFLGATMNAVMTWWAISLVLISHPDIGNEVLSRATLLKTVPVFVAMLVWITRVLFIGSLSIKAEMLMALHRKNNQDQRPSNATQPNRTQRSNAPVRMTTYRLEDRRDPRGRSTQTRSNDTIYSDEPIMQNRHVRAKNRQRPIDIDTATAVHATRSSRQQQSAPIPPRPKPQRRRNQTESTRSSSRISGRNNLRG